MRSVLIHNGWWKIVNGTIKKENAADDKARESWESDDEKALATITLCVKSSILNIIRNCRTSREAWARLEEIYKPKGPLQKVSLYKKLVNLTMVDGGNISQHLNSFTELAEKLSETGIVIQDELLIVMLLSSLPPEFENFVVAIETRDTLPTLSAVKQKLLEEGDRLKQKSSRYDATTNVQQALAMKVSQKSNRAKKGNKSTKMRGKCFNCGEYGHYANKCERSAKKQQHLLHAVHTQEKQNPKITQWCVDSGATSHMCCDRALFTNFIQHEEEIRFEADKYILAKGKGDVNVIIGGEQIKFQNVLYSPELTMNFISVARVVSNGLIVVFDAMSAVIKNAKGKVILKALKRDNLFIIERKVEKLFVMTNTKQLWHNRLGHLNYNSLNDIFKKDMVKGMNLKDVEHVDRCRTCMYRKIHVYMNFFYGCNHFLKRHLQKQKIF